MAGLWTTIDLFNEIILGYLSKCYVLQELLEIFVVPVELTNVFSIFATGFSAWLPCHVVEQANILV
jgi:hypothetical protein